MKLRPALFVFAMVESLSVCSPLQAGTVSEYIFGYTGVGGQPAPQLSLNGGAILLTATDSGSYTNTGIHTSGQPDYIAGFCAASDCLGTSYLFNDFFVFDLSSVTSTEIASATLNLYEPSVGNDGYDGYNSDLPSETFQMFDVTTAIGNTSTYGTLEGPDTGDSTGTAIFNDLGSGVIFGSGVVTGAESGTVIPFALNSNAIAALNTAEGGEFALGGSVAPEPASGLLILAGLAALAWRRKRARASA